MSAPPLSAERLASIGALLDLARKHGVCELSADGIALKLYQSHPAAAQPSPSRELPSSICACGHHMALHRNGICLNCGPEDASKCQKATA